MTSSNATKNLLALSFVKGVGTKTLATLSNYKNFADFRIDDFTSLNKRLINALNKAKTANADFWQTAMKEAEEQITWAEKNDTRILSFFDADYPSLLKTSKEDPCILYVQGKLHTDDKKSVAVIGTRKASYQGELLTERITKYLVEQGQSIVSGLAFGCDAVAHRTAIKHGGHTVAVLAHGLQTLQPAAHKQLAKEILASGGAIISQYPFGTKPAGKLYVIRDRTQAALSRGVVMVQSNLGGGSLHASRAALADNRWLAVPIRPSQEKSEPMFDANDDLISGDKAKIEAVLRQQITHQQLANIYALKHEDELSKLI